MLTSPFQNQLNLRAALTNDSLLVLVLFKFPGFYLISPQS